MQLRLVLLLTDWYVDTRTTDNGRWFLFTSTTPTNNTSDNLYACCSFKKIIIKQGCTNTWRKVAVETKFCTVAPNICGSFVRNWLHVTFLVGQTFEAASRILGYLWRLSLNLLPEALTVKMWGLWICSVGIVTLLRAERPRNQGLILYSGNIFHAPTTPETSADLPQPPV